MTTPTPPSIAGFQYVRPLGKGGFARVWLYEQNMPRRMVAVKALQKSIGDMRQAFETEADMMAKLSAHPAIVSIYEASISADGQPYLVMEFCPDSLGARAKQQPLPLAEVLDAGVRLAGALETAHQSGVLHRDIKPSNVLVTVTGKSALTDFGIADLLDRDTSQQHEMAMSIPWSAPEVVGKVETGTIASEIWALGATLYTFAAGCSPFASRAAGKHDVHAALVKEITRAKYLPIEGAVGYEALDSVLQKAMAKQPAERFSSMAEFGRALQNLQRHYGYDVTSLEVIERAWIGIADTPAHPGGTRGPQVTAVRPQTRKDRREAAIAAVDAAHGSGEPARPSRPPRTDGGSRQPGTDGGSRQPRTATVVMVSVGVTCAVLGIAASLARLLGWL